MSVEYRLAVRLWIDDPTPLSTIAPDPGAVEVRRWTDPFPQTSCAEVVVEAFGAALPESYLAAMAAQAAPPAWLNLEYLSAEPWVGGFHLRTSPHPRGPLTKVFFFPGFAADTGGLLRERGLRAARERFQSVRPSSDTLRVSLFAYENAHVSELLAAWGDADRRIDCIVPVGRVVPAVAAFFGEAMLAAGDTRSRGALTLTVEGMTDQTGYDRLLWSCDLNFVRGEDSFVRGQWAARPIVWQPYVQAEETHLTKLEAFLDRYTAGLVPDAADAYRVFVRGWNGASRASIGGAWAALEAVWPALQRHAEKWADQLENLPDLAAELVKTAKTQP